MTGYAETGRRTAQRRMAGKAIRSQRTVLGNQGAGTDHQVREHKHECGNRHQICSDDRQNPAALHFQPQKRNMLTMCARARTANASVIGK